MNEETNKPENGSETPPQGFPPPPQWGYPPYNPIPFKRKEQEEILAHTSSPCALAVVFASLIFGILFSDIFILGGFGVSVPILIAVFYGIAFTYFSFKKVKIPLSAYFLFVPILLISFGYVYSDAPIVYFINTLVLLVLIPVQLSRLSGTAVGPVFSMQSAYHTLVSLLARPLNFLDMPFKAIKNNFHMSRKGSGIGMVVVGLIIALPVAAIFISLFTGADVAFKYFIDEIQKNINFSFGNTFFDLIFGSLFAIFIATLFITLFARKTPQNKEISIRQGLNVTLISTVLIVINFIQISFVAVQFSYLFSGATLPNGMSYPEYARSGFFELCGVICFSVFIIMLCMIFIKRHENKKLPAIIASLLTVLISCNYVIIASAAYRMMRYIGVQDLTIKRVMVMWLISIFAVSLIGAVIKLWVPSFKTSAFVAITVIVMTIGINACNINVFIATYNVDRYIDSKSTGVIRKINVEYFSELGPAAAEQTARLLKEDDTEIKKKAKEVLEMQFGDLSRKTWKNYSFSDSTAKRVFKENNITSSVSLREYE